MHEPDFNALTAFVERRLDETERSRVVTHLATCRQCRDVVAALASASPETVPVSVPAWRRMTGLWSLAAMLVVVVIVGVISSRQGIIVPAPPGNEPGLPAAPQVPRETTSPTPQTDSAPATLPQPASRPEDLGRVRGNERKVGEKTFRFVSGEWIDASYDPQLLLPVVEATTPAEREALLRRVPNLKPFAALRGRVLVILDGTVYRF
jgi:hypothetical protein